MVDSPLINKYSQIYEDVDVYKRQPHKYADDKIISMEQRITINFWCKNAKQADQIAKRMDAVLESGGFERYTANEKPRYMDDDIGLLMNIRKYRLFDWSDLEETKGK